MEDLSSKEPNTNTSAAKPLSGKRHREEKEKGPKPPSKKSRKPAAEGGMKDIITAAPETKITGKERKKKEKEDAPSKQVQKAAVNLEQPKEMGEEKEEIADTPRDEVAKGPAACCNGCISVNQLKKFFNEHMDMMLKTVSDELKDYGVGIAREVQRGSSTNSTHGDFQFSVNEMIQRLSSSKSWVLPRLTDAEMEELRCKQREQEAVEMEAAIKRLVLRQEELNMRLAKLRRPGNEKS